MIMMPDTGFGLLSSLLSGSCAASIQMRCARLFVQVSLPLWGYPDEIDEERRISRDEINEKAAVLAAALIGLPPATALRSLSSVALSSEQAGW